MSENASPVAPVQNIVHTPGPWGVEQTTVSNWIGRMRADGSKVEYIVAHTDRDSLRDDVLARNDANARLIAAAPDLLTHLRHMIWLVEIELKEDGGHILAGAKAAVAKAISVV